MLIFIFFLDSIGAVESVKAASDIYAPISGIVTEVNEKLGDQPSLLNKQPQSDGTLYVLFNQPIHKQINYPYSEG